ncbi:MAG: ribosome biogenesis GTPase Der [Acidobacteria bacterium]|nr:ribosome biogenesis GTPase Der [Acidobacteriota bacterium]NIM62888.1 ribosome biogenesis GTPase Der [Acidobacteriota bacterium]NIO58831.1 ribosome biogenesis GTPase Der [Acidobacteriota bacterium]NIQ29888.1 ribosome biogenesis GTPase Der [Acidobacteriota bacterium]NIQ84612.1 ribosome biogenesis GTPase Der [Acidobacteriota bacterium]
MSGPLVAIVGAPNVGKSTLFNRMVGKRHAIVTDQPGVTRDRLYGDVERDSLRFRLVDTGGLTPNTAAPFADEIMQQASTAIREAAVLLFVLDGRAGATAIDHDVALLLRRSDRPIVLVANKIDGDKHEPLIHELHELGLGEPLPLSAEHGRGMDELYERLEALLADAPEPFPDPEGEGPLKVAIVGRPNVGKSSLVNRLVGEKRVMVSDIPGTTRDAIDTLLRIGERRYLLIDTAGIRRPGRIRERVERFSIVRAKANIERCDAAILVLAADEGIAAQDTHIAGYVHDAYKPLVVAVNKWDLIEGREAAAKRWADDVRVRLRFAKQAPMVLISALTGQRAINLLERVDAVHASGAIHVGTSELNRWLERAAALHHQGGKHPFRVYYATQTGVHPPRFAIFCNDPDKAHFSTKRYLENSLREAFGFGASPLLLQFRPRREKRR